MLARSPLQPKPLLTSAAGQVAPAAGHNYESILACCPVGELRTRMTIKSVAALIAIASLACGVALSSAGLPAHSQPLAEPLPVTVVITGVFMHAGALALMTRENEGAIAKIRMRTSKPIRYISSARTPTPITSSNMRRSRLRTRYSSVTPIGRGHSQCVGNSTSTTRRHSRHARRSDSRCAGPRAKVWRGP